MSAGNIWFGTPSRPIKDDYGPNGISSGQKVSKLHEYTPAAIENGNRAERREWAKRQKKRAK